MIQVDRATLNMIDACHISIRLLYMQLMGRACYIQALNDMLQLIDDQVRITDK
jgi:hypothetical protein